MAFHATNRSGASRLWTAVLSATILCTAGCNHTGDTPANFTRAIDTYYSAHPSCLWPDAMKFPVQEDTSDVKQTAGYDALVDQGILLRTTDEKRVMIIASKQVNNYDLSPAGHAAWSADPQQPGFGNLCYGHRKVTSIDSFSPTTDQNGATTDVVYRYAITGSPAWATATETQTAFPSLRTELSGNPVGRATLTDTPKGWQVTRAPWAHIPDSDIYK